MRSLSGFVAHFVLEAMVSSILTFPCQYGSDTSLSLHPVVGIRKEERRHSLPGRKLYAWPCWRRCVNFPSRSRRSDKVARSVPGRSRDIPDTVGELVFWLFQIVERAACSFDNADGISETSWQHVLLMDSDVIAQYFPLQVVAPYSPLEKGARGLYFCEWGEGFACMLWWLWDKQPPGPFF